MSSREQWRTWKNGGETYMALVAEQHAREGRFAHTETLGGVEEPYQRTRHPPHEGIITSRKDLAEPLVGLRKDDEIAWMEMTENLRYRGEVC